MKVIAGLDFVDLAVKKEAGLLAVMKLAGDPKFDMGDMLKLYAKLAGEPNVNAANGANS
jgi:hypothetical protein|tara:strand:- start:17576 stop:17752 length:177 start_codon:yes stop_codon:yes gene_type:complete